MAVPWEHVRSWLRSNKITYEVIRGPGSKRILIELRQNDADGRLDRTFTLYAAASATLEKLGTFRTDDLIAASRELRIDWP